MKQLSTGLCTLVFLFLISSLRPVQAQMTADATRAAGRFSYDGTEEITVTGTVSSVLAKAAPGMIAGSYLVIATPSGLVDASLGRFGLRGNGAVLVAAGEQIEVTGVMKTLKDKPLFLVKPALMYAWATGSNFVGSMMALAALPLGVVKCGLAARKLATPGSGHPAEIVQTTPSYFNPQRSRWSAEHVGECGGQPERIDQQV